VPSRLRTIAPRTAFFVKNGDGFLICGGSRRRLRWTCAGTRRSSSAYVLYKELGYTGRESVFQSKSGALRVTRDGERFVLDFPSRPAEATETPQGWQRRSAESRNRF